MFVCYFTFGCKVNQYETELIRREFCSQGFDSVSDISKADICVINTCTVTAQSDLKMRKLINRVRRENPACIIAVCGCYPQAFGAGAVPDFADIVAGSRNKQRLPELVKKYIDTGMRIVEISTENEPYPKSEAINGYSDKTRAIIKIQDGCDRFCTYCIIPYARGRSRSKPLSDIISEAENLKNAGHNELVIVGINLSDYGKGTVYNLADAVEAVCSSGVKRVRLGSLEPEELSEDIIKRLSKLDNLCPHFHIALQSGCNKTLREMNRKYDKEKYFTLISELRRCFPNCAITSDIMVGFPGESEADFLESLEFVSQVGFADAHVFPYSKRSGTLAAKRDDQVDSSIKERRAKLVSEAVSKSKKVYLEALVGTVEEVLFEREKTPEFHQGHSANYCVVKVKRFTDTLFREFRNVKITSADEDSLYGEII